MSLSDFFAFSLLKPSKKAETFLKNPRFQYFGHTRQKGLSVWSRPFLCQQCFQLRQHFAENGKGAVHGLYFCNIHAGPLQ